MKKFIVIVLFFICSICQGQVSPLNKSFLQIVESENKANSSKLFPSPFTTISDYDVKYHRLELKVNPAVNYIQGEVTTYFKPLVANFDTVKFNLSDSLSVDSVKYHSGTLLYSHIKNIVKIILPNSIAQNTFDSISVFYQGVPDSTGFGSFVQTTHSATNNSPIIWTLSEPYGASDWWPCKKSLIDKADSIDVIVTAPTGNKVASNGLLVSTTTMGANKVFHWKHRYPIATYLICFAVSNYAEYFNTVPFGTTNLMVQSFVYPEDSASVTAQTVADIPIIQLYDTLFGNYPFINEKYGHVECGRTMEHQTMSFFGETSFGFETLAHELAHQWFGNKITCASWEDIWLNEGFATYLSGLAYEHMLGGVWWMPFKESRVTAITSLPGGSVLCDDTTSISRIFDSRLSYAKGAMILHQLRWIFGDSVFFAALNNYLSDPNLAYSFAKTSDFKQHFEIACGQNLNWYFNDWYSGEGFPSYQINWNQVGNTVNFTVNQTQSDPSVSFFEMPLPIEFKNQTQDTILRFDNVSNGQTFSTIIPFKVDSVKLDPELWLITANNSITSIAENNFLKYISVFPNPVRDKLQIEFSQRFNGLKIKLMDVAGKEVSEIVPENWNGAVLNCKNINAGFYILQFTMDGQSAFKKIVIE